jgi:hypothetical protein
MKKLIFVLPLVAALGGCATLPPITADMILQDVRLAARALCGLQPTAVQVQHVIAANNAGATSALEIARLVCGAIVQ